MTSALDKLVERLHSNAAVAVWSGAGISAESGIPTFRGAGGLWKTYRAEELATPQAFARDPQLVWQWYSHRRAVVNDHQPNAGHYALAQLAEHVAEMMVITQCVDGYHQAAGMSDVIELHGNILQNRCHECGKITDDRDGIYDDELPRCNSCNGRLRPNVVWFGESLPVTALEQGMLAAAECSVFLSIGASALVYPAAYMPEVALSRGAFLAELNLEPTALTPHVHAFIEGPAATRLPELIAKLVDRCST